jgi:hypothetical protein
MDTFCTSTGIGTDFPIGAAAARAGGVRTVAAKRSAALLKWRIGLKSPGKLDSVAATLTLVAGHATVVDRSA